MIKYRNVKMLCQDSSITGHFYKVKSINEKFNSALTIQLKKKI